MKMTTSEKLAEQAEVALTAIGFLCFITLMTYISWFS